MGHIPREISCCVYLFLLLKLLKQLLKFVEFWRIRSSSLIDLFVQGKMGCPYHGGIYSKFFKYSGNQSVDISDSKTARNRTIIKLSLFNQKRMKIRRGKKVNRQGHTCSYYNKLINIIFYSAFTNFKK